MLILTKIPNRTGDSVFYYDQPCHPDLVYTWICNVIVDRDFICVQSMDGTLSVYEQESFSFTRFLPDSLLPGPICYVAATDSFVTISSARNIESYK